MTHHAPVDNDCCAHSSNNINALLTDHCVPLFVSIPPIYQLVFFVYGCITSSGFYQRNMPADSTSSLRLNRAELLLMLTDDHCSTSDCAMPNNYEVKH